MKVLCCSRMLGHLNFTFFVFIFHHRVLFSFVSVTVEIFLHTLILIFVCLCSCVLVLVSCCNIPGQHCYHEVLVRAVQTMFVCILSLG